MSEEIKHVLQRRLSAERYTHSLGVGAAARRLAACHGVDVERAGLAGLLHDYARDLPVARLAELAEANHLINYPVERLLPVLWHAPVGAMLVRSDLGIQDQGVLDAISKHTTGHPDMTMLDKIIFLADIIEPGRSFSGVDRLRELAGSDLDGAMLAAFDVTLLYIIRKGNYIHPISIEARNRLLCRQQAADGR